jgi:hypothetical protein
MANLVVSEITITGPKDELEKVAEFLKSDEFDFDLRKISENPSTSFYDGEEPSVTITEERYKVNTATRWIAPIDEMEGLSKIFPDLTIEMEIKHYDENLIEYFTYKNGETLAFSEEPLFDDEDEEEDWDEEEGDLDEDSKDEH